MNLSRSCLRGCGWVALVLGVALASISACKESGWVDELERAHVALDDAETEAQREQALRALERAYAEIPASSEAAANWARQDVCARLADAALRAGDPQKALSWAEEGLLVSPRLNVARAELLRLKGDALEALGQKAKAAIALHEALKANQALMERALDGETTDPERP